jgi:RimJ/RimL family protein N-acetyltransferase
MDLHTSRLDLLLITAEELFGLVNTPTDDDVFRHRAFTNPHGIMTQERIPHANRIADVRENPEHIKWYYRLIVERSSNILIGSISFHAGPDDQGMLEVGLGIAEPARNNGFASEALDAMWRWAVEQPSVASLRYTVSPDNAASQAMIAHYPAEYLGQQIDDEDGPEDIYQISVDALQSHFATLDGQAGP